MQLDIPVIETERLVLRGPVMSDFDAHADFMASDRSAMVGGPLTRDRAWRGFIGGFGHWVVRGYGYWIIADKDSNAPLGKTGISFHEGWDEPELGWHVYDQAEGRGIAFEAASAAREYAAQAFGLDGVISYIVADNPRSIALAERLGAIHERDGAVTGIPCRVYRHPKVGGIA